MIINGFVGATLGLERTILPLIVQQDLGIGSATPMLSFIAAFGLTKACANFLAGALQHSIGRKRTLLLGWICALPVPIALMLGTWKWIVIANLLLGLSQGLTWSTTVVMKVDIAGQGRRGFAIGLNESAGYVALGVSAWLTGYLADVYGLRPIPFYPGIGFVVLGLLLSLFVNDTRTLVEQEHAASQSI